MISRLSRGMELTISTRQNLEHKLVAIENTWLPGIKTERVVKRFQKSFQLLDKAQSRTTSFVFINSNIILRKTWIGNSLILSLSSFVFLIIFLCPHHQFPLCFFSFSWCLSTKTLDVQMLQFFILDNTDINNFTCNFLFQKSRDSCPKRRIKVNCC